MVDASNPKTDPVPALTARAVERLRTADCFRLLQTMDLGRLAVVGADGAPDIFPTNYVLMDEQIFLRSAPGSKLVDIARNSDVAYEADGREGAYTWSVVIRGKATRLAADDEIDASGILELQTATPTGKDNFIRIVPSTVTGRRFRSQRSG